MWWIPSRAAIRHISIDVSHDFGPSSMVGKTWQWRSIIRVFWVDNLQRRKLIPLVAETVKINTRTGRVPAAAVVLYEGQTTLCGCLASNLRLTQPGFATRH